MNSEDLFRLNYDINFQSYLQGICSEFKNISDFPNIQDSIFTAYNRIKNNKIATFYQLGKMYGKRLKKELKQVEKLKNNTKD